MYVRYAPGQIGNRVAQGQGRTGEQLMLITQQQLFPGRQAVDRVLSNIDQSADTHGATLGVLRLGMVELRAMEGTHMA